MADRKTSPLADDDAAPWDGPPPARPAAETPEPDRATPANQRKSPDPGEQVVPIREGRRKRSNRQRDDFALVSFNCNLPVITRRAVRAFAAEHDVDVQDVVNDALIRYLADFGTVVPRTRSEQE